MDGDALADGAATWLGSGHPRRGYLLFHQSPLLLLDLFSFLKFKCCFSLEFYFQFLESGMIHTQEVASLVPKSF